MKFPHRKSETANKRVETQAELLVSTAEPRKSQHRHLPAKIIDDHEQNRQRCPPVLVDDDEQTRRKRSSRRAEQTIFEQFNLTRAGYSPKSTMYVLDCSRAHVYRLIDRGELDLLKDGKKSTITALSIARHLARLQAKAR